MPAQPAQAAVPHPLDEVPQTFKSGDSYAVRDGLVTYIRRDLLGPWDGETETLPSASSGPRDRYLVGMLGPRPHASKADEIALAAAQSADTDSGDESEGDDSEPQDRLTPQAAGHIWASSMGLSFTVPASVGTLSVVARWGRYTQSEEATDQGTTRRVWSREPVEHPVDIDVTGAADRVVPLEGDAVALDVQVRHHAGNGGGEDLRIVELALVNRQEDSREARDAHWLFQTSLEATAFPDDQAAVFYPVDDPLDPANRSNAPEDAEDRRLRLLYRDSLSHAKGRNVAVLRGRSRASTLCRPAAHTTGHCARPGGGRTSHQRLRRHPSGPVTPPPRSCVRQGATVMPGPEASGPLAGP